VRVGCPACRVLRCKGGCWRSVGVWELCKVGLGTLQYAETHAVKKEAWLLAKEATILVVEAVLCSALSLGKTAVPSLTLAK